MAITDVTTRMRSNEEIIGRVDINDPDAILSVTTLDETDVVHAVEDAADAIFTWGYDKGERAQLNRLYEKAKTSQWNATTDLPWELDVDVEKLVRDQNAAMNPDATDLVPPFDVSHTPLASWGDKEYLALGIEMQNHLLSQFMHGEQGALLCTAKIVETVPWIDAKYYAATQVMDEARHVEVFARYLDEKLTGHYPINAHLRMLLDDIINDSRWDMTYLGMQIMVEGLALAAFGMLHQTTSEPLLKKLLRYVMSDEARHVAFGVLSLEEYYRELNAAEIRERQEFAFEAAVRMRDRFLQQEVWQRYDIEVAPLIPIMQQDPGRMLFQQLLFSKIVPNCKKLGLLDAGAAAGEKGWLRERFEEMDVIQFEDLVDTGDEYEELDAVAEDRAAANA
ncbi:MAG: ferritin-like domain-containing protein [Acidimicrobiia bacterium]|nr:ferritin-like domain-containing protein [Acidimicrobiia bacterium]